MLRERHSAGLDMNESGRKYFDACYPDYDAQNKPAKISFYLNLVRRYVREGEDIFELGVGLGKFIRAAQGCYKVSGCDPNGYAVAETSRMTPAARIFTGSFETIQCVSAPAAVVSWDVLEHVPELNRALQAIRSRLAPGGILIAVVPVYDGPLGWLVGLLDRDPTHVWKRSRRWWYNMIKESGFELIEHGGILRKMLFGKCYLHWTRPRWIWRWAGSAVYFAARKTEIKELPNK